MKTSDTRQHILVSTAELIAHQGSSNIRVKDVILRANVGLPTLYYHFDSKSQLVAEAQSFTYFELVGHLRDYLLDVEAALDAHDENAFLNAVSNNMQSIWITAQDGGNWRIVNLLRDVWHHADTQRAFSSRLDSQIDRWVEAVKCSMALGWIDSRVNPHALVVFCWSAPLGQMIFSDSERQSFSVEDVSRIFLNAIGSTWVPQPQGHVLASTDPMVVS